MRTKVLFGLFGILIIALVACQRQEAPQPPMPAPSTPAPAPAMPAPAPTPAPAPSPAPEKAAPVKESSEGVTRDKVIYPSTKGEEPVPTESKYEGKEGSFIAGVECGVKDDKATVSLTVQNPTKEALMLGDRPQVFDGGGEMVAIRLNGRYVLDYLDCKDYNKEAGIKSGEKVACSATVPPDSNKEKVLIRHAPNALGNPTPNTVHVYSPSGGREQVQFAC